MAKSKKISELEQIERISGNEEIAVAIDGQNYKVTPDQMFKPGYGLELDADRKLNVNLDLRVFTVVDALPDAPAEGDENKIHLVPDEEQESGDIYEEYLYVNGAWEKLGDFHVPSVLSLNLENGAGQNSLQQKGCTAGVDYSFAEGYKTETKNGWGNHAEGRETVSEGFASHAEGWGTKATMDSSHSEGNGTEATAMYSHAEGRETKASGVSSHSEGNATEASGQNAHAEGNFSKAKGYAAHAEGNYTEADACAHAEGSNTKANKNGSHAEGQYTVADGDGSHAEGYGSEAKGYVSHTEGQGTVAENSAEHAEGVFNKSNTGTIHSVGIGSGESSRKNAHEIMDNGDHYVFGVGGYDGTNPAEEGVKTLQETISETGDAIKAEENRATEAEGELRTAINDEKSRAQSSESALQSSINAEKERAESAEEKNAEDIKGINAKIPTQASEDNQLADKDFVNSSIATATAEFKGTYDSADELSGITADMNDYAFVRETDENGNLLYKRYKYTESSGWEFEFSLNNSSFTASQWAAINSNITEALVQMLTGLPGQLTDLDNRKVGSSTVRNIVGPISEEEFSAIQGKTSSTMYIVTD